MMAGGVAVAWYARHIEPYRPRLERVDLPLPMEHAGLDGLTIGFLTDTHVGPFTSLDDVRRGLDLLLEERPDLLLLGGDYASESPRYVAGIAALLGNVAPRFPLGVYGVMGNHDYSISGRHALRAMAEAGIPLLRNEAVEVRFGSSALWIAGIDDSLLGRPDAARAIGEAPAGAAVLALWHEPQFVEVAAAAGAFAQLSGHTHGGQVSLPGVGPLSLPLHGNRHVAGLSDADGMPIYTSRGLGIYRPPVRLNCPPEVTLVTLCASGVASKPSDR